VVAPIAVGHPLTSFDATTGLFAAAQPAESDLSVTDIATNNVSTAAHGFAPKAPNDATKYLDGTGAYSTPAGGATSPLTTKGDLYTFATANARLPVGTNGQVLTANSGAANGVDWEAPIYDVTFSYPGAPPNSYRISLLRFPRPVQFPANFSGAYGYCETNPTATSSYILYQNGTQCGSVVIGTTGNFTFSTTGGAVVSFAAGDRLDVLTPASDLTLSNVTMTFSGVRI
jgi:hypothetical protein